MSTKRRRRRERRAAGQTGGREDEVHIGDMQHAEGEGGDEEEQAVHEEEDENTQLVDKPHDQDEGGEHTCLHPLGYGFQWIGLFVIAFITFGTSVAYDSVGALGPQFEAVFKLNAQGLADLYSVYHLPNLVLVFFGGMLADRIGIRSASLVFSMLVFIGCLTLACAADLGTMLLGRFVFGMGSEALSVVQLGMLTMWFARADSSPSLGLACAVALTIKRSGTLFAFDFLPVISSSYGLNNALWVVAAICAGCLLANMVFCVLDMSIAPYRIPRREARVMENISCSKVCASMRHFPTTYWLITAICVCHYSVLVSFSDFSADFFRERYGLSELEASRTQSLATLIGLVLTPVMGQYADKYGHRATLMLIGNILLIPAHLIVTVVDVPALVSCALQGLASSCVASALWPSLALVLPAHSVNTAVGLLTAIQNSALFTVPLIVGEVRVHTGSYRDSVFFYLVLDFIAIYCCVLLLKHSDVYGDNLLELPAVRIAEKFRKIEEGGALDVDDEALGDEGTEQPRGPIYPAQANSSSSTAHTAAKQH